MTAVARRCRALVLTCAAAAAGLLAVAGAAAARDEHVRSFDGTRILVHFFPRPGRRPTGGLQPC
jgi:ABC-type sugar transport system substrate-binding protein